MPRAVPSAREQQASRAVCPIVYGAGHTYHVRDDTALGAPFGGFDAAAVGPISFPFALEWITVNLADDAAAGAVGELTLGIFIADTGDRSAENVLAARNLVRESTTPSDVVPFLRFSTFGQELLNVTVPFNALVPNPPKFLLVVKRDPGAAPSSQVSLHVREIDRACAANIGIPIFEPRLGPAPAPRRSSGPPAPRAVVIRVFQGGRTLSERTVPWPFLAPELQARVITNQLQGLSDQTIEPLL